MLTGGQIPAGQTALGRSPCQGGAVTHAHRRSNPCRPDRTRQVAVSGRSRDTRSQAVKSLPARPHLAGRRAREEPRHTRSNPCRPDRTLTGGQIPAGQTALGRLPCQGGAATHVHRRSNPCRPDRTRQVAVSGRSRDTRSQAVKSLPARAHSAGRRVREEPRHTYTGDPCRPDRTRQVAVSGRSRDTGTQTVKSLPARPHSAGRRVREEPRHRYTGGQIPAGKTTLGRSLCQGGAATHIHRRSNPCRPDRTRLVTIPGRSCDTDTHVANPVGQITLIKILQAHLF